MILRRNTLKRFNKQYGGLGEGEQQASISPTLLHGTFIPPISSPATPGAAASSTVSSNSSLKSTSNSVTGVVTSAAAVSNPVTVEDTRYVENKIPERVAKLSTPTDIYLWFNEDNNINYYKFIYGSGKILKFQEDKLQKELDSLEKLIEKTNTNYEEGARASNKILQPGSQDIAAMKGKLNEEVEKTINESYKTEYFELIQKKIRYTAAIESIRDRRSYLVHLLNLDNIPEVNGKNQPAGKEILVDNILFYAEDIYKYYRGSRYEPLRGALFEMIFLIANVPEVYTNSLALNASITGPAGSGKTTLARKMANWYNVINLLTGDSYMERNDKLSFIETDRSGLIAQYLGQTAPKTLAVLYNSLEKTLFIDEAYAVPGCTFTKDPNKPDEDSYGSEFVATLLPFMANHKGLYSIIIAGYKNLIDLCFFARNEGLPRRFPLKIDLPLYSTDELYNMMLLNIINKRQNIFDIKDDLNEFKLYRQSFYMAMKPFMMMIHFDTSIDNPFDLLRKYILLFNIMDIQNTYYNTSISDENVKKLYQFPSITKIYSHTILIHILICCLPTSIRRNMMRIEFFNTVFNFDSPNLSYFPAQAGEMELLADKCINNVEPIIDEIHKKTTKYPISIPLNNILNLYNSYLYTKNVKLVKVTDEKTGNIYFEFVKDGYDVQAFIKDKLSKFLLDKIFPKGIPSLVDFFVQQQTVEKNNEIVTKVNEIFNNPDYFTVKTTNGKDDKISMFIKVYRKIKPLSETEFPINIDKNKLEVELYNNDFFYYKPKTTLQSFTPDAAWEDVGKIINYQEPTSSSPSQNAPSAKECPDYPTDSYTKSTQAAGDISNTGLDNCGNKCYLNSVLIMMYNIPEFRNKILDTNISTLEDRLKGDKYEDPSLFLNINDGNPSPRSSTTYTGDMFTEYKNMILTAFSSLQYIFTQIKTNSGKSISCTDNTYDNSIKYLVNILKHRSRKIKSGEIYSSYYTQASGYKHTNATVKQYTDFDSSLLVWNLIMEDLIKFLNLDYMNLTEEVKSICTDGKKVVSDTIMTIFRLSIDVNKCESLQDSINKKNTSREDNIEACRPPGSTNKNTNNGVRETSLKVPESQRYLILNLVRDVSESTGQLNDTATFKTDKMNIEKTITVDDKTFTLYGCILFINGNHYTYVQFDNKGDFIRYYNDMAASKVSNDPPAQSINKNGVIFVYKRNTTTGGTLHKIYNNLRLKQLQYGRKTRRKLQN
jgi:hypothetical protein